ncbi:MAG: 2-oxo-4-hydroxy-4-carboxy-5-ureidoimidazoline decarboxylase [Rhodospirillaceae bacterium]|jgi:2-oxo-4-hydroxy-4-carboxy-5-ureidoimidazoline decarboxylase|nr:2-oxo-4-hydroxy-4-carboxy-5-ureidoimidazoline decarboxylase [Rhodospirillaceae bacterium]MBT5456212.1 2-oxo-4-hydroxy-4-carboxy-5-ureidoimidazoline decarboxylase [Rhodospirillaceae bacterium]
MADTVSLRDLNEGDQSQFIDALGDVFEHSPWLVERASAGRPFGTRSALLAALLEIMTAASEDEKLALIRAHPDLAGKAARAGDLTDHSISEQASAGLDRLSDDEFDRFNQLNDAYKEAFGFPFIIAVRDHHKESILAAFESRLTNSTAQEIDEAIRNISRIVSLRVVTTVTE